MMNLLDSVPTIVTVAATQKPLGNGMALRRVVVIVQQLVAHDSDCKLLEQQLWSLEQAIKHLNEKSIPSAGAAHESAPQCTEKPPSGA